MGEDFTKKFSESDRDTILTAIEKIDSRLEGVEKKVDSLEKTVNERLYDTRPIWHKVVYDIGELQAGQQRLEEGQHAMRMNIIEMNSVVRDVNRDQIILNDVVRRIQLDFHNIDERLHKLIVNHNQQNSST